MLRNHLVPEFGGLMLRELTLEKLQGYYTRLQSTNLSAKSVDKIRDVHSAVMRTAAGYGRIGVNPLEKVRLKRRRLDRAKPFLRAGQFFALAEAWRNLTRRWCMWRPLRDCGSANWQVLRRSCATWLQQAGVDVKDAQGLLRHSRASTTQDIYQQIVEESQHRAVRKLTAFVEGAKSGQ